MNVPNLLTLSRIILIPLFVVAYYAPMSGAQTLAASLFVLAAITDWLDGYLARRWGQTSAFGAFFDPVADKLMVAMALLIVLQNDPRLIMALPVAVIIGREITVSALREWMAEIGHRGRVAVSMWGKVKTTVQMISLVILLLADWPTYPLGLLGLYIAAILTLWSMIQYLLAAWPSIANDAQG
ncbi:MAG: CDP-diacylglycerol--glycerol-3-phosphate 3-phosphatidyltransferase [Pseudomonadota bacterium]|nr:CDP-diacylglycerol--glycerol-3-phosphate 3-phosphatidyltransferase [Pseudomonadota bacterium]